MADIGENFRTFVLEDTNISAVVGTNMEQNKVDQDTDTPFIYYSRTAESEDMDHAGNGGISDITFSVQCVDEDIDASLSLAELVKARLDGYKGAFGTQRVLAVFVNDRNDDYYQKPDGGDIGFHVASLSVRVLFAS